MADYFTSDHFKLLNKWKGTIYDKSNPERRWCMNQNFTYKSISYIVNAFDKIHLKSVGYADSCTNAIPSSRRSTRS